MARTLKVSRKLLTIKTKIMKTQHTNLVLNKSSLIELSDNQLLDVEGGTATYQITVSLVIGYL